MYADRQKQVSTYEACHDTPQRGCDSWSARPRMISRRVCVTEKFGLACYGPVNTVQPPPNLPISSTEALASASPITSPLPSGPVSACFSPHQKASLMETKVVVFLPIFPLKLLLSIFLIFLLKLQSKTKLTGDVPNKDKKAHKRLK